ncbi:MAG: DUF3021 family protein [Coriobacteriales bacterium]
MSSKIIDTEKRGAGEVVRMLCINFCIAFTIFMLMSMVFGMIFADEQAKAGIMYCWTIALAMLVAVVLQLVFFTPLLIKKMGYGARVALFGICFYAVLAPLAVTFDWFPAAMPEAWVSFTVIYLVILVLLSALFTALYRKRTRRLNEMLAKYKEKR